MKKPSLRAFLFDFDGVLADTEPVHLACFKKILSGQGIELSKEEYYEKYLGLDDRSCFEAVFRDRGLTLSAEQQKELMRLKNTALLKELGGKPLLLPGVRELVGRLAGQYYLAVVSGALKSEVLSVLRGATMDAKFQVVVAADDVTRCKPDPEGFVTALRLLNRDFVPPSERLLPQECLVVEDSPWGIEASRKADMKCLALLTSYSKERLAGADRVVKGLKEVTDKLLNDLFPS